MKKIALIGNPNSGKTTLFNILTGLNQKVGNFPGVTVEKASGMLKTKDETFEIFDLPGTFSINPKSPDEEVVFSILTNPELPDFPDYVILVADALNLKRSLYVATQVAELGLPCLLALNMIDMSRSNGTVIHLDQLQQLLGIPVLPVSARNGEGISELINAFPSKFSVSTKKFIDLSLIDKGISAKIQTLNNLHTPFSGFYFGNHFEKLEKNEQKKEVFRGIMNSVGFNSITAQQQESILRFKTLQSICDACVEQMDIKKVSISHKIDRILTHKFWGLILFSAILFFVFQFVFELSKWPMEWIDSLMALSRETISGLLKDGLLKDLILDGVLAGFTGIIIFIPQIALLFSFIALLEETGYMARVSYMMDLVMRPFGLNGRSVIPLISGVACAVPSILATRTIGSPKERLLTILVTPLMSCSARLPVYSLMIALVIPPGYFLGLFSVQGMVLLLLYALGLIMALLVALLFKSFIKESHPALFAFDLPPYRTPRWSSIGISVLNKIKSFLSEAGGVIMAISIVLWALASFGPEEEMKLLNQKKNASILAKPTDSLEAIALYQTQKLEHSYAGKLGKSIEPLLSPLGFDWKIGIALVTSFAAREVFVGTMNTIYSVGESENSPHLLLEKMRQEKRADGKKIFFDLPTGISLMLFYAFALQCMSTIAVVKSETKTWKWPILQFLWMGGLAWIAAWLAKILFS